MPILLCKVDRYYFVKGGRNVFADESRLDGKLTMPSVNQDGKLYS